MLKIQRFVYTARNFATGLTDVTAKIRRNGIQVATGVALTEVGNGRYELVISVVNLGIYGGAGFYDIYINSAGALTSAPAVASRLVTVNDEDELETHLGVIEGKVDTANTNVSSIKSTVEDAGYGLANLKSLIDSLQSSINSVQNNTNFVAPIPMPMYEDNDGATLYRIPIRLYDSIGNMEDADGDITVSVANSAGTARNGLLVGSVAGAAVAATKVAATTGEYFIDVSIPTSATHEQINFVFAYAEGGLPVSQVRTSQIESSINESGVAIETTSQAILTKTSDIQTVINNASYGLANLKALIDVVDGVVDSVKVDSASIVASLANGTNGLAALKAAIEANTSTGSSESAAITTNLNDNIKGPGFDAGADSLHQLSLRLYTGGGAI